MTITIGVGGTEDAVEALARAKARIEQLSDRLGISYFYEPWNDTALDAE